MMDDLRFSYRHVADHYAYPFEFWPFGEIYRDEVLAVEAWCLNAFGETTCISSPEGGRWTANSGGCFWFRNPDDAFAFRMRWC